MARVPDLVRDSKLVSRIVPGGAIHTHYESGNGSFRRRPVPREEHWKREKKIGRGAFGNVWLESCTKGQGQVQLRAVKEIATGGPGLKGPDYNRELEAIAKFSQAKVDHCTQVWYRCIAADWFQYERCFVKSFGWYEDVGTLLIAMEYFEHGDLHRYMMQSPPLPENEAGDITFQILEGLSFMHENYFAHRDLKPNNILVKLSPPDYWWVKIGDFGISKRAEDNFGASTTLRGTLGFIAPELHGFFPGNSGRDLNPKNPYAADMWSLGEIAFQLLVKKQTFANLGLLYAYVQSTQSFPSEMLIAQGCKSSCQDFIKLLMKPASQDRLTADQALSHDWIQEFRPSSSGSTIVPDVKPSNQHVQQLPDLQDFNTEGAPTETSVDLVSEEFATWNTNISKSQAPLPSTPRAISKTDETIRASQRSEPQSSRSSTKLEKSSNPPEARRGPMKFVDTFQGINGSVNSVAFSLDGTMIASGSNDNILRLFDTANYGLLHRIFIEDTIRQVAFSPILPIIAVFSGTSIQMWGATTGSLIREISRPQLAGGMAFSPSGMLIATGSTDGIVRLWNTASGTLRRGTKAYMRRKGSERIKDVLSISFSDDDQLFATTQKDSSVTIWSLAGSMMSEELPLHPSTAPVQLAYSGDMIAASSDKVIRLWHAPTKTLKGTLVCHMEAVLSLAFSPNGKLLVSGSADKTIRLWDVPTAKLLGGFNGHPGPVSSVAFSPDGQTIATGSSDRIVRLWLVNTVFDELTLRFRGRDGQFLLKVFPDEDIYSKLPQIAEKLPADVDLSTITFSNQPYGGDMRTLESLKGVKFSRVGFSNGDRIYLDYS